MATSLVAVSNMANAPKNKKGAGAKMSTRIMIGDVMERIKELADNSVNCCVTSPPYWGLRDYGVVGQLGIEKTPQEHIAALVQVFREVRRVIKPDGTLWVNYGDMYASSANGRPTADIVGDDRTYRDKPFSTVGNGFKPKDLIMMSAMLALALQADGWYLRNEIIWHKPNAMPESVKDRCAVCHEKLFLFSKSPRYFFDVEAIKEPISALMGGQKQHTNALSFESEVNEPERPGHKDKRHRPEKGNNKSFRYGGIYTNNRAFENSAENSKATVGNQPNESNLRLKRTVWIIPTKGFSEAHFATFPPDLISPCIMAGCPVGGVVLDPFGGAGTTALVAEHQQKSAILIELNPEYADMARRRISEDNGLFAAVDVFAM